LCASTCASAAAAAATVTNGTSQATTHGHRYQIASLLPCGRGAADSAAHRACQQLRAASHQQPPASASASATDACLLAHSQINRLLTTVNSWLLGCEHFASSAFKACNDPPPPAKPARPPSRTKQNTPATDTEQPPHTRPASVEGLGGILNISSQTHTTVQTHAAMKQITKHPPVTVPAAGSA
jgi:hypothetical protein